MIQSTTDGKIYRMVVCACGKQNTAGICEHVKNPVHVEQVPPQNPWTKTVPHVIGNSFAERFDTFI